jgi:hypothetical protein
MTKTFDKRNALYRRIEQHGQQLLAIFPDATERDPVKLCKRLRRLEAQAWRVALRLCNGPEYADEEAPDRLMDTVLGKVNDLLGNAGPDRVPVFVSRDPRGCALKIDDEWMREHKPALYRDWGGYGLIAPDLTD